MKSFKAPTSNDSDPDEIMDSSQVIAPIMPSTGPVAQTINQAPQPVPSSLPVHQGELMGAPRIFGLRNQNDYSAKSFVNAMQRCWALNPAFFISDLIKISYAATRLAGTAETWFSTLEERDDPCLDNWEKFKVKFLNEFSSTRTDWQNRVDLYTLKQGKLSIFEYTSSFRALSNSCNFGDEALLTGYFLGLNSNIQMYLESLQTMPSTLSDIIATCLDYGSRHTIVRRPTFPRQHQSYAPPGTPAQPMEIDAMAHRPANIQTVSSQPRPPLSPEEKDFRQKNNLCLYCGSDQHFVLNCPGKPKNL